jgi:hypothetical protein
MPADPRQTQHPKGYWFDQEAGERVVTFIEKYCRHTKGEWAGQLIRVRAVAAASPHGGVRLATG